MRRAAAGWEDEYSKKLVEEAGFERGVSAPAVFKNKKTLMETIHKEKNEAITQKVLKAQAEARRLKNKQVRERRNKAVAKRLGLKKK